MKKPLKSCLFLSKDSRQLYLRKDAAFLFYLLLSNILNAQQIKNYVSNGSFEMITLTQPPSYYNIADYWQPIDTGKYAYYQYSTLPPLSNAPFCSQGFQNPRSGNSFIAPNFYHVSGHRGYPRNRLKKPLDAGKVYCAKYFVVNTNNSPVAIDSYGMYFSNSSLDSIKYCNIPLDYLIPQVENVTGIITDTLNWIPITGTFVATGDEKYLVLGNFKSNAATNTLLINPTFSETLVNDIYIDDVSVIEMDDPAYAGPDKAVIPGDSVFIGSPPDIVINEYFKWYKLPDMNNAIDSAAGIWVKPVVTSTYVVRQQLWCSGVKWDTVVVYLNGVGIDEIKFLNEQLKVSPLPASDHLQLRVRDGALYKDFNHINIYNITGQCLREEEINFSGNAVKINTSSLPEGLYFLKIGGDIKPEITKRFLIRR